MPRVVLEICDMHNDNRTPGERYTFAWLGEPYEILLCDDHRRELEDRIRPFLEAGERVRSSSSSLSSATRRRSTSATGRPAPLRAQDLTAEEKDYARSLGWQGRRISNDIAARILERRQAS